MAPKSSEIIRVPASSYSSYDNVFPGSINAPCVDTNTLPLSRPMQLALFTNTEKEKVEKTRTLPALLPFISLLGEPIASLSPFSDKEIAVEKVSPVCPKILDPTCSHEIPFHLNTRTSPAFSPPMSVEDDKATT